MTLRNLGTQSWWLGVGGLLQAVAAILSLIVLRQGERMHRQSVAPGWSLSALTSPARMYHQSSSDLYALGADFRLTNEGAGTAFGTKITFRSRRKLKPRLTYPIDLNKGPFLVGMHARGRLEFSVLNLPCGTLTIESQSRLGHVTKVKYRIWVDIGDDLIPYVHHEVMRRRSLWACAASAKVSREIESKLRLMHEVHDVCNELCGQQHDCLVFPVEEDGVSKPMPVYHGGDIPAFAQEVALLGPQLERSKLSPLERVGPGAVRFFDELERRGIISRQ